jgi:hypothetical protein
MRRSLPGKGVWLEAHLRPVLLVVVLLLLGCQAKEPPLSPAAASFKKEVKHCLTSISGPLVEPVHKKDVPGIMATLGKIEPQTVKLCRMCPFSLGVLNRDGETLAVYPPKDQSRNFSSYDLIAKAVNTKKIQQQRFFLQNGSELYMVCAPILRQDTVIGLVAIAIDSKEAQQRWGLTEKEFLALDFNT